MYESGAKKRKKFAEAAKKHEEFMLKVPKLSTFFNSSQALPLDASSAASIGSTQTVVAPTPTGTIRIAFLIDI